MTEQKEFYHYGILRKSGRYPWGSGKDPYQRSMNFRAYYEDLRSKGLSPGEIAKGLALHDGKETSIRSTTDLRAANTIARNQIQMANESFARRLKDKGMSNQAIAERMGLSNESSVRALLDPSRKARVDSYTATAELLKKQAGDGYLQVGLGIDAQLGIPDTKLKTALAMLGEEGYTVHTILVNRVGDPGKDIEVKVLAPPGATIKDVYENATKIKTPGAYTEDFGHTYNEIKNPVSLDSSRLAVRYGDDGGKTMDGVIELRPGVKDISLGGSNYAQVRIAVDGTHYIKGMAVYSDDLPKGVDIRFNTNKIDSGNKFDVLKPMDADKEAPFGSIVRQHEYIDDKGNKQQSVINKVGSKEGSYEEGGWDQWSRALSSQFLSKQPSELAKQQLDLAYQKKKAEFDEIQRLTNPTVKKKCLESFADKVDAAASDLKGYALPRQATRVILPLNKIKDTEIYAPGFKNGERVVLVRHPHGGTFELPELVVNNRNLQGKNLLGQGLDTVGINYKVAQRLSGADFDGDTVIVIPNDRGQVKTSPSLKALKDFDPIADYKNKEGMPTITAIAKGKEMGKVSNLITDMTIKGATQSEIAQAVKHSMVVIDAEKHNLNYKQSEIDHGIAALKEKYQNNGTKSRGASTIVSRANAEVRIPDRKPRPYSEGGPVDKETGEKRFVSTGKTYKFYKTDPKTGVRTLVERPRDITVTRMSTVSDARELTSKNPTPMEMIYAHHANKLKALANKTRLAALNTPPSKYNPSSAKVWATEVQSLTAKLNAAKKNAPLERKAQILANAEIRLKRQENPNITKDQIKKINTRAIIKARARIGAGKERIAITNKEWEAIQAGAVSDTKLKAILANTDDELIKTLATPHTGTSMTSGKLARARMLIANGYTQAEIAAQLGISTSTLSKALNNMGSGWW